MIAALYVETDGVYCGRDDVDPWDLSRDARGYAGPHPVIAHPPCKRWGRYWSGGPSAKVRRKLVDDEGCFDSALEAVRRWGGVLEHPEGTHAWRHAGLHLPPKHGGWIVADNHGGWTCCVEQGHYGHQSRKATWLYAFAVALPSLRWGKAHKLTRIDEGFHSSAERFEARAAGRKPAERIDARQRAATPAPFADLLISIAKTTDLARGATAGL